ncbi:hypothetical protein [Clostridioides difficile]|uniref:hypothetical protein n=1 Tax=Clostridioides difficile TaxID=1496 RepID=UPI001FD9BB56|nr:hypothetical protein [Clostridioides difficile]
MFDYIAGMMNALEVMNTKVKKKLSRQLRKNLRGSEKLNDGFILEKKKKLIFPT